jgi:hypothetical protein
MIGGAPANRNICQRKARCWAENAGFRGGEGCAPQRSVAGGSLLSLRQLIGRGSGERHAVHDGAQEVLVGFVCFEG